MHHTRFTSLRQEPETLKSVVAATKVSNETLRAHANEFLSKAAEYTVTGNRTVAKELYKCAADFFTMTGFNDDDAAWCLQMAENC